MIALEYAILALFIYCVIIVPQPQKEEVVVSNSAWDRFAEQYPRRSARIKELGGALYAKGAEEALRDEKLDELCEALREVPEGELGVFGLSHNSSPEQVLVAVLKLGADMIFALER